MKSAKYSIIIPVYNKEEYLDECISSVINQEYKDIEILLINDGSTDNSLDICKKYEAMNDKIVVFDKNNSGVSDTRNFGIEKSSGQYIIFVDADDVLAPMFLSTVDSLIDSHDILLYRSCRNPDLLGREDKNSEIKSLECYSDEILKSVLYNQHLIKGCNFNFNRVTDYVVSASLLKENKILFNPTLKVGEDKVFNFKLFQTTTDIVYANYYLYYIRTNGKSVMGSYNPNSLNINNLLFKAFETEIGSLNEDTLKSELNSIMPCLGYQVVRNAITSDYCHKKNPQNYKARKIKYEECKKFLNSNAEKYLNDYDKFLFNVFQHPFFFIEIVMKNRVFRGGFYYVCKFLSRR